MTVTIDNSDIIAFIVAIVTGINCYFFVYFSGRK